MEESNHEEHLSHPLQANKEQFQKAITFLIGYNGIFDITNKKSEFSFKVSNNEDDFTVSSISPEACGIESLNNEINIIDEG